MLWLTFTTLNPDCTKCEVGNLSLSLSLSLYPSAPKTHGAASIKRSPHLSILWFLFCCFACTFFIWQHFLCWSSPCFIWSICVFLSLRCPPKGCCRQQMFRHSENMANPFPSSLLYIYWWKMEVHYYDYMSLLSSLWLYHLLLTTFVFKSDKDSNGLTITRHIIGLVEQFLENTNTSDKYTSIDDSHCCMIYIVTL
jgi:hypothetical protein